MANISCDLKYGVEYMECGVVVRQECENGGAVRDDIVRCGIMWPMWCDLKPIWYCKVE